MLIYGVYVKEEYHGKEIGKKLSEGVLKVIQQNKSVAKIRLTVTSEQTAALVLYKRYGFKIIGKIKKELNVNGKYYDRLILEKFFYIE